MVDVLRYLLRFRIHFLFIIERDKIRSSFVFEVRTGQIDLIAKSEEFNRVSGAHIGRICIINPKRLRLFISADYLNCLIASCSIAIYDQQKMKLTDHSVPHGSDCAAVFCCLKCCHTRSVLQVIVIRDVKVLDLGSLAQLQFRGAVHRLIQSQELIHGKYLLSHRCPPHSRKYRFPSSDFPCHTAHGCRRDFSRWTHCRP